MVGTNAPSPPASPTFPPDNIHGRSPSVAPLLLGGAGAVTGTHSTHTSSDFSASLAGTPVSHYHMSQGNLNAPYDARSRRSSGTALSSRESSTHGANPPQTWGRQAKALSVGAAPPGANGGGWMTTEEGQIIPQAYNTIPPNGGSGLTPTESSFSVVRMQRPQSSPGVVVPPSISSQASAYSSAQGPNQQQAFSRNSSASANQNQTFSRNSSASANQTFSRNSSASAHQAFSRDSSASVSSGPNQGYGGPIAASGSDPHQGHGRTSSVGQTHALQAPMPDRQQVQTPGPPPYQATQTIVTPTQYPPQKFGSGEQSPVSPGSQPSIYSTQSVDDMPGPSLAPGGRLGITNPDAPSRASTKWKS
ncbi:hypothetical protein FRB94_000254 [Tulasnella sp. JGI-2019a]|nr:hypothetical protein FRB94_000254 [Tulasnella sp. JGI-2019a]